MFSMQSFYETYDTDTADLVIRERKFKFFMPKSLEKFVDSEDLFHEFPLWSKIWEASIVLADHIAGIRPEAGKNLLELGCGLGVVGVVGSFFGHKILSTENNPDALNFARANARINGLHDESYLRIQELDWNKPEIEGRFDTILASEVIYKEADFQPLLELFKTYLRPGGEIILAEGIRKTSMEFFRQMGSFFDIEASRKIMRSKGEECPIIFCKMRFKDFE